MGVFTWRSGPEVVIGVFCFVIGVVVFITWRSCQELTGVHSSCQELR